MATVTHASTTVHMYMYIVPVVDILDWNESGLVVPGQHIDGGRAPVVVVHIDHINGGWTWDNNRQDTRENHYDKILYKLHV